MTVTRIELLSPAITTPAARALANYRTRLAEILRLTDTATPAQFRALNLAVAHLVDELSHELLLLYQQREHHALTDTDRAIVMPALERVRDVLRHRQRRSRPLHDTLHKAIIACVECRP
jgi:hypothetical protein